MPSGLVFGTGPRRGLRFGPRMGRLPGLTHHPLMIPDRYRTVESAGKKPSRHEKPTVALRASVRRHRSSLEAVTVRESMVTSRQDRIDLRGYFPDASVDPTEARTSAVLGTPGQRWVRSRRPCWCALEQAD